MPHRKALLLALFLPLLGTARAEDLSAKDIASRAAEAANPGSLRETLTMALSGPGTSGTRSLTVVRRKKGSQSSARLEFLSPKDVAGTVLLTLDHDGTSDQYLYLPGLKRTRRIAGGQRSGAFQGSDFTYEDLASRDPDSADYKKLDDETVGADPCWQIEITPKKGVESGYGRMVMDVRKSDFLSLRARYFDAKGAPLKNLEVDAARVSTKGPIHIPLHLEMKTLATGHATVLDITDVKIDAPVDDALFDPASLDRG
jgi:Outer membrane lipoprotein-sorting protein